MSSNIRRALSFAAAGAFAFVAGGMQPALVNSPALQPRMTVSAKRKKGLFNGFLFPASDTQIGRRWSRNTVARDKRAAAKRRNVLRNKGRCS